MLRITVTAKAELEDYIKERMKATGDAAGTVCKELAQAGMEYKQSIKAFSDFSAAVIKQRQE